MNITSKHTNADTLMRRVGKYFVDADKTHIDNWPRQVFVNETTQIFRFFYHTWPEANAVTSRHFVGESNHVINIRWGFDQIDLYFEQVFKRERSKGLFHYNAGTFGVNSLKYRWWVCCQLKNSCLCLQIFLCVIRTKFMNVWWLV